MRRFMTRTVAPALAGIPTLAYAAELSPQTGASQCPLFNNGSFVVNQFQLYPENAKFDFVRCQVYFGALFNASVAFFNPYTNTITESITFPGLSGNPTLHLGPASPDPSGRLSILIDAAPAFNTAGKDVSGSNIIIKYDYDAQEVIWQRNITEEVTQGAYGGFQDIEHDKDENVYIVGTFPGTILRVDKYGNGLEPWYLPDQAALADTTVAGFGGIAAIRDRDLLLVNNDADGEIYRFDNVSKSGSGTPVLVPRTGPMGLGASPPLPGDGDAILLPAKYKGTVLLVSADSVGVTVLRSRDSSWKRAETLGTISNNATRASGGSVTATIEIGPRKIFMLEDFFTDPVVAGTNAGNRSVFPLVDITNQVDELVRSNA